LKKYLTEVEERLKSEPRKIPPGVPEAYIGGGISQLNYIGLRVPQLDAQLKKGFSFSQAAPEEVFMTWDYIWNNSNDYEVMALAIAWVSDKKQLQDVDKYWSRVSKWSERIDNWAHSDSLSKIYAMALENDPKKVYPQILKWSKSKNPWLRRQSIVSLMYYSSSRKKILPLTKILPLIEKQIEDDHKYVQKGVGWSLREAYNVYPKPIYKFLTKNVHRLSAYAFSASTEKMSADEKNRLKKIRQEKRVTKYVS
jgi:3-methyladenine DNA glycosylase AlkD